jgi:hypothetical protein
MPDIIIEVEGLEALQAKLDKLADVGATCGPALLISAAELQDWVKVYPPKTIANRPHGLKPDRWYERGMGGHYITTKGEARVYKTSQRLDQWGKERHTFTTNSAEVIIGPKATYAKYVHDEKHQVYFHALRGWRTAQAGILKFEGKIARRIEDAISRAIGG